MKIIFLCVLIPAYVLTIAPISLKAQTPTPVLPTDSILKKSTIPEHILYKHFFDHVAAFSARANWLDLNGQPGANKFRYYFLRKMNLSLRENEQLEAIAQKYAEEMKANEQEIKNIVRLFREKNFPNNTLPKGVTPPPPPPELKRLNQQRKAIIQQARTKMEGVFSFETSSAVNHYVHTKIAANSFVSKDAKEIAR